MVQAEQEQRQQEAALRERRAQIEKSQKENMENFGPERFARLHEDLTRTSEELVVAKEQVCHFFLAGSFSTSTLNPIRKL